MKKLKVNFRTTDGVDKVGTVVDKVLVAVVGGHASYNNYVIIDNDNIVHIVGLFNIKSVVRPELKRDSTTVNNIPVTDADTVTLVLCKRCNKNPVNPQNSFSECDACLIQQNQ